jgi:hypothetical protein
MKKILLAACITFILSKGFAQIDASLGAVSMIPSGTLSNSFPVAWGPSVTFGIKPFPKKNFWLSLEGAGTTIDHASKQITLISPTSPETATTDMRYTTNMNSFSLTGRYEFPLSKKFVAYNTMSFVYMPVTTRIRITDPTSEDDCVYLEDKKLIRGTSTGVAFGGGFKFKFARDEDEGINGYWIDASISYISASRSDIANLNNIQTLQHGEVFKPQEAGGTPVGMTFRNIHTNTTHEHFVMQVQNHPLRMLQLRIALVFEGMPWEKKKY